MFAVGTTTVWRYVREAVDLLAEQAPTLAAALWLLAHNGHQLGILDGTVVPIDRLGGPQDRRVLPGREGMVAISISDGDTSMPPAGHGDEPPASASAGSR